MRSTCCGRRPGPSRTHRPCSSWPGHSSSWAPLFAASATLWRLGTQLRQALEISSRCGAVPIAERARSEAVLAGARPRRSRLSGIHALTPGELRVARLAAKGRTNREVAQALVITTKTVKDHLGSAYGKLQITSRAELAEALTGDD